MTDQRFEGVPAPSASVQQYYLPVALVRLRNKLGKDNTVCWILVALAALASWTIGPFIASVVRILILTFSMAATGSTFPEDIFSGNQSLLFGSDALSSSVKIASLVFPVGVFLWAQHIYKTTRARTIFDLTKGNMALMLADEQFGLIIEEAVQEKFRVILGKVQLGGDLAGKVNHFAYYYKYYYRMSFGPSYMQISSVSAESCWLEGCAIGACNSCPVILIALVLRIILVRPRILGIKTAVAEYLEGRHDHLLEYQKSDITH